VLFRSGINATYSDISNTGDCSISCVITREWVLTDDCGNITRDTQMITIRDTISPTFTPPADVTVYGTIDCTLDTIADATEITGIMNNCNDLSDLDITYVDNITPDCAGSFDIERIWTITDQNGNSTSETQTIEVRDTIDPTFTTPGDITVYLDASCMVNIDTSLTIGTVRDESDGCSTNLDATYADVRTDDCTEGSYTITRTWTLTDDCLNTTTGVQTITVLDTIKPTFTAPRDTTLYTDASCLVDLTIGSTGDVLDEMDNCTTTLNATYTAQRR